MNRFDQNPAAYQPIVMPKSKRLSAIKIIAAIVAAMFGTLLGVLILLLIGAETGWEELFIGMLCATLPVPIYVMLLLWIDRYEAEPLWMLATSFFWGAIVAVFISLIFNTGAQIFATVASNSEEVGDAVGAVISAPIVEESAKALILVILSFGRKTSSTGLSTELFTRAWLALALP